jgi:opacity protein-like surface antigen
LGAEHALTPAWSLKVEYDYLALGSQSVTNLGSSTFSPVTALVLSATAPSTSALAQHIQLVKVGVNYRWGADPGERWDAAPAAYPEAAPMQAWLPGWEAEMGGRYFGGWGQFHKDIGNLTNSGLPSITSVSRLTYDEMHTNAGELFGRFDSPWNVFIKGYLGGGFIGSGRMNDEDFGIPLLGPAGFTYAAYSNTLSPVVTGSTVYGAFDGGFDFLRGPGYKVGAFAGYFYFNQQMNAAGCAPLANINCIPPLPVGSPVITENDTWRAWRIGLSGETMLSDRLKLSGEAAYLPYVIFAGVDQHFFGNSGIVASNNPESGTGRGVQLEAVVSYYVTPKLTVGVGGRYWGMWTTSGQVIRDLNNGVPIPPTQPQFFKSVVEQGGAFVQASYSFGPEWF